MRTHRAASFIFGAWLALSSFSPALCPAHADETPGRFPEASTRALTAAELANKNIDALSLMRNEVFARHGHRFKSKSLDAHFQAESWYKPQVDDASSLLTEQERKNVALIRQVEKQQKDAQRLKDDAEAQAAWDKLPLEVQTFWQKFRAAIKSGSAARISAFVGSDFRDGLEPMMRNGRSVRVGRSGFSSDVQGYLPDSIQRLMQKKGPSLESGVLRFYTGEMEDDDVSQAGRIYRFKGKEGSYQLVGVYVAAGPGDEG